VQKCNIQPETTHGQPELLDIVDNNFENRPLMKVIDQINRRFPKAISMGKFKQTAELFHRLYKRLQM